jgi:hypothetical protein
MGSRWYVKGISLAVLIKSLTKFQAALLEHVSITQAPQRPSPSGHPNRPVALNYSCARRQTRKRISKMPLRCQPFTRRLATTAKSYHVGQVTINMLPDEAVLEIFSFFLYGNENRDGWHPLVHVCRKWRNVIFGSPRRLNLRLHCTARTPVKEMLDIWPPFPIVIKGSYCPSPIASVDNIVAALAHNDRICEVMFGHTSISLWEIVLTAMQVPFPELTRLHFESKDETVPVVPDSFLGGSAPRLRSLSLDGIPFPGLSKLLLSATDLVDLSLSNIPHSGYIAPPAMATCLATLTRLKSLSLNFQSPRSRPDPVGRFPHPAARTVLPALTDLRFTGVSEYLEDLVARIDAPLLHVLDIKFFLQLIFDTPQLAQFIDRTPQLKMYDEARVVFSDSGASVSLPRTLDDRGVEFGISCRQIDWQLSSLAQICDSCIPQALISAVEHLHIVERRISPHHREDDIENSQWLELFLPFTTVRNLYLSKEFAPRVMLALQEFVGDRATGILPALQYLHLEVPPIWTSPRHHREVRCCATAPQTPDNRFSMGQCTAYSRWPVTDIRVSIRITFHIVHLNTTIFLTLIVWLAPGIRLEISIML